MRVIWIVVSVLALLAFSFGGMLLTGVAAWNLSKTNQHLAQQLDAANVRVQELENSEKKLKDLVTKDEEVLSNSIFIGNAYWCTDKDPTLINENFRSVTQLTMRYLASLPKEVDPSSVCLDYLSRTLVPTAGEYYLLVKRFYAGGSSDALVIYFGLEPQGEDQFLIRVLGHYDLINRKWVPAK